MIRTTVLGVSLLAVCLVAVGASAQVTAKLTYADFTELSGELSELVRCSAEPLGGQQIKWRPDGVGSDATCFGVKAGGVPVGILIDPAKVPTLYVDTDADLNFADERAVKSVRGSDPWTVFLRVPAVAVGHKQVRFTVHAVVTQVRAGRSIVRYACIGPAGACSGMAPFGDTKCGVALLDMGFDGRYTVGEDLLAIDVNGDGRFEASALEVMPLGEMARVGGVLYSVEVEPDGSSITFTETKPKFGALKVNSEAVQVVLASRWGEVRLSRSERDDTGAWSLPVGKYTLRRINLDTRGESGEVRVILGQHPPKARELEITEGETLELALGPPLTFKSTVAMRGGTASVNVELIGQGGETYTPCVYEGIKHSPPPILRILDEKGNLLVSGALKYG